jgi:hypothetical protein
MSLSATQQQNYDLTDEQIITLVDLHGVAHFHSSGHVVLKNGMWLLPEQWKVRLQQMIDECETENGNHGY